MCSKHVPRTSSRSVWNFVFWKSLTSIFTAQITAARHPSPPEFENPWSQESKNKPPKIYYFRNPKPQIREDVSLSMSWGPESFVQSEEERLFWYLPMMLKLRQLVPNLSIKFSDITKAILNANVENKVCSIGFPWEPFLECFALQLGTSLLMDFPGK